MLLTESQPTKGDKSGLIAVCCLFYDYLMFCLGLRNDFGSGSLAQLIFRKEVLFFYKSIYKRCSYFVRSHKIFIEKKSFKLFKLFTISS